ncbi:hypothetical protein TorRG33x02_280550 [Trema orientale]|uniref:Uncharacterized protein n=1 Tax=Trema orientale TaxID=63057 RepID=A0A2P5CM18_TREOI|nr:hypothetical protein TorRG33x02_280550 [Trema orientale]
MELFWIYLLSGVTYPNCETHLPPSLSSSLSSHIVLHHSPKIKITDSELGPTLHLLANGNRPHQVTILPLVFVPVKVQARVQKLRTKGTSQGFHDSHWGLWSSFGQTLVKVASAMKLPPHVLAGDD